MPDLDALVPVIVLPTTVFGLLVLTWQAVRFKSRTTHAGNIAAVRTEATEPLIPIIYTTARNGTAGAAQGEQDRTATNV
jgi:hypothetical protein